MSAGHTELAACPFCGGGKARTIHIRDGRKVACICGACGRPEFNGPLDRPDAESRAITAWNTRAIEAAEADLLGKALEALLELADSLEIDCECPPCEGSDAPAEHWLGVARRILSQAREVTR